MVLQSAEDGRDPHSQYLCIEHTAEERQVVIQKLVHDRIRAWTACTLARMVVADGLQHNTTLLFSILMPSRYRAEASPGVP